MAVVAVATAAFGLVNLAHAEMTADSKLSANDKKFVMQASKAGMSEVANAKMAEEKATDEATKKVAARLIKDHTAANERLQEIAKEENLDLSQVEPKKMEFSGDKQYLTMVQKHHQKDIAMFEKEANDEKAGEDRDVPKFARETLPTLKEHLAMINDALAKLK